MKKSWLITGISILILLVTAGAGMFYFSPSQKLQRHGYSADESAEIIEKVNPSTVDEILAHEYQPDFVNLTRDENYQSNKIILYLEALEKNQLPAEKTIKLVNHPDFNPEKTYSLAMVEIMSHQYYLSSRADRYFSQLDQESSVTDSDWLDQIISRVNSDRDYDFYTTVQATDVNMGQLMLVNKYHYLDETYVPNLAKMDSKYGSLNVWMELKTYESFQELFDAALNEGIQFYVTSGYRDYDGQAEVFASWTERVGEAAAPNYAALPGYSEHQTGYAIDVFTPGTTTSNFAYTPAADWLATYASEFGFILRYPEDKVDLTGYDYEAWHLRFVGREAAKAITEQALTLEEYYALITETKA